MSASSKTLGVLSLLAFPFFYAWEVVAGALRISWDVLHPRPRLRPVLVRVPVGGTTPRQLLLLGNLVTMTPGTLTVDVTEDATVLVVHGLYDADDPGALVDGIRDRYLPFVRRLPI
jgi:multicomponent Na+:H+ antiporter subunit E